MEEAGLQNALEGGRSLLLVLGGWVLIQGRGSETF